MSGWNLILFCLVVLGGMFGVAMFMVLLEVARRDDRPGHRIAAGVLAVPCLILILAAIFCCIFLLLNPRWP